MEIPKKETTDAFLEADPNTYSRILNQEHDLNESERGIKTFQLKTGEILYELQKSPHMQQFTSRILKAGFPVADVVEVDGSYFSYAPKELKQAQELKTEDQIKGDLKMIAFLTNDVDHHYAQKNKYFWRASYQKNVSIEHPIDKNEKMMHAAYYDFDLASGFFLDSTKAPKEYAEFLEKASPETKRYLLKKSQHLLNYWSSQEGREQVKAAFKETGKTIGELFGIRSATVTSLSAIKAEGKTFDDFYNLLLERIQKMHTINEAAVKRKSKV